MEKSTFLNGKNTKQYTLEAIKNIQNSKKLLSSGFVQKFSVLDAIKEIKEKYESKKFKESSKCYTVNWMKKINL